MHSVSFRDVLKYAQSKNLSKIDLASVKAPHTEKPTSAGKTSAVQPAQAVPRAPPTVSVSPDGGFQDIETTSMRRVIAQRLTQSKVRVYNRGIQNLSTLLLAESQQS